MHKASSNYKEVQIKVVKVLKFPYIKNHTYAKAWEEVFGCTVDLGVMTSNYKGVFGSKLQKDGNSYVKNHTWQVNLDFRQ